MDFLEEIRKRAGEEEKQVKENKKIARNADLANKILHNTQLDYVVEMAQQHFDDEIFDLIQKGKYSEAAQRYIDNQQAKGYKVPKKPGATVSKLKKGSFSKGFVANKEKAKKITDEQWDEFSKAYEQITGAGEKRDYKGKKGTEDPRGEVITSRSTIENAKGLRKKVKALAKEFKELLPGKEELEREEILSHMEGLQIMYDALENTIKGKATIPPETEEGIKKLKERYKKIGKTFEKRAEEKDEEDKVSDEERAQAFAELRSRLRGFTDHEDVDGLWRDWHERKKRIEAERFGKQKDPDESTTLKGKILSESLEYSGHNFWKNYIASSLVRGFAKDLKILGEDAKFLYMDVFGTDAYPIFEYMEENKEALFEAAKDEGYLLFELHGRDAESLKHAPSFVSDKKGFLAGLWDKVKSFGAPIVSRLSKLIEAGASWAKNIAEQGISWIGSSPVAQVAVPAVVLAGSVAGGVALVNKIRKKQGKKKLSKREKQELKNQAEENSDEIEKYSKKKEDVRDSFKTRDDDDYGEDDFEDSIEDEEDEEKL